MSGSGQECRSLVVREVSACDVIADELLVRAIRRFGP